jgi:hypothetical protein
MKKISFLFSICVLFSLNAMGQFKGLLNKSGTIVFSKTKIDPVNGKALPPASFESADKPLGMAFLNKPLSKNKNENGDKITWFYVRVTINEKRFTIYRKEFKTEEEASVKELEFQLFDIPTELQAEKYGSSYKDFISFVNGLKEGSYPVKVEITRTDDPWATNDAWTIYTYAEGALTLVKKSNSAPISIGGKKLSDFQAGMSDPKLEKEGLVVLNSYYSKYFGSARSIKQKILIISRDWGIQKNENTGVITGRSIKVMVHEINPVKGCRLIEYFLTQSYNGSGYQNSMFLEMMQNGNDPVIYTSSITDCE